VSPTTLPVGRITVYRVEVNVAISLQREFVSFSLKGSDLRRSIFLNTTAFEVNREIVESV